MIAGILSETLVIATPLWLAASGGLLSERSGVINFALEGQMLAGAFAGAVATLYTGSPLVGLVAAAAAGMLLGIIHAFASVTVRMNQIVSSFAVNLLAIGVTGTLCAVLFGAGTGTPPVARIGGFAWGSFRVSWLTVVAVLVVLGLWAFFRWTVAGLRTNACGENATAAWAAGLSVRRVRYLAVTTAGALPGLGGAFLSLAVLEGFSTEHLVHGRGFLAVATVIFARWRPALLLPAGGLFALAGAVGAALQVFHAPAWLAAILPSVAPGELISLPANLAPVVPYVLVLIALAAFATRGDMPGALGKADA